MQWSSECVQTTCVMTKHAATLLNTCTRCNPNNSAVHPTTLQRQQKVSPLPRAKTLFIHTTTTPHHCWRMTTSPLRHHAPMSELLLLLLLTAGVWHQQHHAHAHAQAYEYRPPHSQTRGSASMGRASVESGSGSVLADMYAPRTRLSFEESVLSGR